MARKPKPQIAFQSIKRSDVPFWHPVKQRTVEPTGSKWDAALTALASSPEVAILITEPNKKRRGDLKATLQTIAKNRGMYVKVRNQNELIFAWRTDEPGRFPAPEISN
jgi:hypothetical protein